MIFEVLEGEERGGGETGVGLLALGTWEEGFWSCVLKVEEKVGGLLVGGVMSCRAAWR